jgi:hypothetical protein
VRLEVARRLLPGRSGEDDHEPSEPTDQSPVTRPLEVCPACGLASVRRVFSGPPRAGRSRAPP